MNEKNIARIANAALHTCPERSTLNVNHVFPVCPVLLFDLSVVFPSRSICQMCPLMTYLKSLSGHMCKQN